MIDVNRGRAAGAVRLTVALTLAFGAGAAAQSPDPPLDDLADAFRFGPYERTIAPLVEPAAVAIAPDDTIYVAEAGAGRIRVFNRDADELRVLGRPGPGPGEFVMPQGLAVTDAGQLVVADGGNQRIQIVDTEGAFVRGWGVHGRGPGEFSDPRGVAVAGNRVYVADLGNDRVQVFDLDGDFKLEITGAETESGRLNRPVDVAVGADGAIYVADSDSNRIEKFDRNGVFLTAWGDYGPFVGLMDMPGNVAHRDGQVYVADTQNHRMQIFDADGELLLQWGYHAVRLHEGEGRLHYPNAFAIAPSGAFGVICESFEGRAQIFAGGDPKQVMPARAMAVKAKQSHFGSSIDSDARLLVIAEPETHRIHVFETSSLVPILIGSFGERGTRFGQMIRITGLQLDVESGRLYVLDAATRRLQVFRLDYDPDEAPRYSPRRARLSKSYDLDTIAESLDELELAWPIEPIEMEQDPSGNLYLVDSRNSMIFVFDSSVDFIRAWGGYGTEPGQFRRPTDVAFDAAGDTAFVVDSNNHRVQAFDREGRFLLAWGTPGDGPGQFERPLGIAAGRDGFVYVTDSATHRVQKFTEQGEYVTGWGGHGVEHGQLWAPQGIEQDDRLRLIVIDQGNHRAQMFSPEGEWLVTCGTGRSFTPEMIRRRDEARKRAEGQGG